jgi:hypothetical protein
MRRALGGRYTLSCIVLKKKFRAANLLCRGKPPGPSYMRIRESPHAPRQFPADNDIDTHVITIVPLLTTFTNKIFVLWQWSGRSSLSVPFSHSRYLAPGTWHRHQDPLPSRRSWRGTCYPIMLQYYIFLIKGFSCREISTSPSYYQLMLHFARCVRERRLQLST